MERLVFAVAVASIAVAAFLAMGYYASDNSLAVETKGVCGGDGVCRDYYVVYNGGERIFLPTGYAIGKAAGRGPSA